MNFSVDRLLRAGVLLAALYPLQSYAAQINAVICEVDASTASSASNAANLQVGAHCAQFSPAAISFDSRPISTSAISFDALLNTPFFNANQFSGSDVYSNFLIEYTGQTFLHAGDNIFNVVHDDGVVLRVGGFTANGCPTGEVVCQPQPTSPANSPFTVTAPADGLYDFTLDYAECCGPPAVLQFQVNSQTVSSTPEPTTMLLIGSALMGLKLVRFRKRT
jgi:hypothetical protein